MDKLLYKIDYTAQKFHTLDTYDYFEEQEEAVRERKKQEDKYLFANKKKDNDLYLLIKEGNIEKMRKKIRARQEANDSE